ncbi:hypothetical protein SAMN05444380_109107 [Thermophagus xiamenensis]|uniref:Uncharacterized protein n=1 Tax=Thermophagus xiamenensis TaxID=385682 RepID=A0A1I1ZIF6_9BACT|nr:hypothetical protein SAMN05444380_109107 [Thermophagus xiamenensis]
MDFAWQWFPHVLWVVSFPSICLLWVVKKVIIIKNLPGVITGRYMVKRRFLKHINYSS